MTTNIDANWIMNNKGELAKLIALLCVSDAGVVRVYSEDESSMQAKFELVTSLGFETRKHSGVRTAFDVFTVPPFLLFRLDTKTNDWLVRAEHYDLGEVIKAHETYIAEHSTSESVHDVFRICQGSDTVRVCIGGVWFRNDKGGSYD